MSALRQILWKAPGHFQHLLLDMMAENPRLAFDEAQHWLRTHRTCWQASYTVGRILDIQGEDPYDRDTFWSIALQNAPADAPEVAEMRRAVGEMDMVDDDDPELPFDDIQELIKRMARGMFTPGDDEADEDDDDADETGGLGDFSSPFSPRRPASQRTSSIPAPAAPASPAIDLERVAAAAGCARELDLTGLQQLCALTRSSDGPGRFPAVTPALREEIARLQQLSTYLRSRIRDPAHKAWLAALIHHLAQDPQRQRQQ